MELPPRHLTGASESLAPRSSVPEIRPRQDVLLPPHIPLGQFCSGYDSTLGTPHWQSPPCMRRWACLDINERGPSVVPAARSSPSLLHPRRPRQHPLSSPLRIRAVFLSPTKPGTFESRLPHAALWGVADFNSYIRFAWSRVPPVLLRVNQRYSSTVQPPGLLILSPGAL